MTAATAAQVAYDAAARNVPTLVDGAADDLATYCDEHVIRATATELLARGVGRYALACLAAHAVVDAAKARREVERLTGRLDQARQHPTIEPRRRALTEADRADIAHEVALDRQAETRDG